MKEEVTTLNPSDVLLDEMLTIMKTIKDNKIKKKIITFAKIIANDNYSLLEDKYD